MLRAKEFKKKQVQVKTTLFLNVLSCYIYIYFFKKTKHKKYLPYVAYLRVFFSNTNNFGFLFFLLRTFLKREIFYYTRRKNVFLVWVSASCPVDHRCFIFFFMKPCNIVYLKDMSGVMKNLILS